MKIVIKLPRHINMLYEGNLKFVREMSEGNNGSPWDLILIVIKVYEF